MNFMSCLTSPGSLQIRVTEGTDLADGLPPLLKQLKQSSHSYKLHAAFLRIAILDESDAVLQTFTSQRQSYQGSGCIDFYNEEFFFTQALPTYSIRLSTYFCHHVSPGVSSDQCAGEMLLPLNRLEENVPVMQWYQICPMDNKDRCIKSAVRFEICFFNNDDQDFEPPGDVPNNTPHPNEAETKGQKRAVQYEQQPMLANGPHFSAADEPPPVSSSLRINIPQLSSSQIDSEVIDAKSKFAGAQTTPNRILRKSTSMDPHLITHATPDSALNTKTRSTATSTSVVFSPPSPLQRRATTTSHFNQEGGRNNSLSNTNSTSLEEHLQRTSSKLDAASMRLDKEKTCVRVGVVQHAILIGPSSMTCTTPLPIWRDSNPSASSPEQTFQAKERERRISSLSKTPDGDGDDNVTRTSSPPNTNADQLPHIDPSQDAFPSSCPPVAQLQHCADICIWDQYPSLSMLQSAECLPEKLEWFAFPNGPKEIESRHRPPPEISSFLLHTDTGELEIYFCVCLTFYLRGERKAEEACTDHHDDHDNGEKGGEWWNISNENIIRSEDNVAGDGVCSDGSQTDAELPVHNWMGVCLCLMTRSPIVTELSSLLSSLYESLVCEALLAQEASLFTREGEEHYSPLHQLPLRLCHVLEPLCFNTPFPIPGYMDIEVRLDFSPLSFAVKKEKEASDEGGSKKTDNVQSFRFSLNDLNGFPQCAYSIEHCLHLIGARTLVDLLYHALSEHKILLHSNNLSVLPMVSECIRLLIHPLQWSSVYIPTVPSLLLDLVDAPVPFILGISSSDLMIVDPSALRSLVRVDCDSGKLYPPCKDLGEEDVLLPSCRFAPDLDRWCVTAIKTAMATDFNMKGSSLHSPANEFLPLSPSTYTLFGCTKNAIFQSIIFDCLLSMLCYLPDCVYNVGSGYPQMNVDMLLDGYAPPSADSFLRTLSTTQAFHRMISGIHRSEMNMFLQCCTRLRHVFSYVTCDRDGARAHPDAFFASSSQMFPLEQSRFYVEGDTKELLESSLRKNICPPYHHSKESDKAQSKTKSLPIPACASSRQCNDLQECGAFPNWAETHILETPGGEGGGSEIDIKKCVFQVLCRYQEVLGCFSGQFSLFAAQSPRATFTVEIDTRASSGSSSPPDGIFTGDLAAEDAVCFPPFRFDISTDLHQQLHPPFWRLDEVMRKLKRQHVALNAQMPMKSDEAYAWKRLFRLLTTCKVNQKLNQQKIRSQYMSEGVREGSRSEQVVGNDSSEEQRRLAHGVPPPAPSSPSDRAIKRLHFEYMHGSDDITRLVLKILPVRFSNLDLDDELVAKLQFHNTQENTGTPGASLLGGIGEADVGKDIFSHGEARRRVIEALKGYSQQLVITFIPLCRYQQQHQEAAKKHMTLPRKRIRSLVEQFSVDLHSIAFGYLHQLFKRLLQACTRCNDYLTAYAALEISGYYYQVLQPCTGVSSSTPDVTHPATEISPSLIAACSLSSPPSPPRTSESKIESQGQGQDQISSGGDGVDGGLVVQSLRSRICHDPIFASPTLWLIVMNDVMSSKYTLPPHVADHDEELDSSTEERGPSLYDIVKPVIIHMMECNIPRDIICELLKKVMVNFEIHNEEEECELMDRFCLLWQVGRDTIRKASGDVVRSAHSTSATTAEEKLLVVRRLLHSTQDHSHVISISTPKSIISDSPMRPSSSRVASRSFDFASLPLSPSPLRLGQQISTTNLTLNPFDNDALFVTDDDEGDDAGRPPLPLTLLDCLGDGEYCTDTDLPPKSGQGGTVRFTFAGQPRHESSLGSTPPKQLTSMHSACVTAVDIAQSQYNYVLQPHTSQSSVADKQAASPSATTIPTLALSHHLLSGDAEGHVYVTNWSSSSTRTQILGKQKHSSPVVAVRGLPNDFVASACSGGELKVWNLLPERRNSIIGTGSGRMSHTRKAVLVTHKPFASTPGPRGSGISGMVLSESPVWRGAQSTPFTTFPTDDTLSPPEELDPGSWLLAVGGVAGGLKVFHGNTEQAHSRPHVAGGAEVLSVTSPDRSYISCLHLVAGLCLSSGETSAASLSTQLPTRIRSSSGEAEQGRPRSTSAANSFNSLLKYKVHSRIQSLLSSPDSSERDKGGRSSSSGCLFSGSSQGQVCIFDLSSNSSSAAAKDSCVFISPPEKSHSALVSGVVPVPFSGGKRVVSGGYDRLVKYWDARVSGNDCCCLDLGRAGGAITHVAVDESNHHRILGLSSDNVVRLWDTRVLLQSHTGEPYMSFHAGHSDRICDIMQTGGMLLTACSEGTISSWDINTGKCVQTWTCNTATTTATDGRHNLRRTPKRKSLHTHASLACARLLNPLISLPSATFSAVQGGFDSSDHSSSGGERDGFSSGAHQRRLRGQAADAMLVTGDYGGTVKVWRSTGRSNY